uniref:Uncharacterized protein n=1 Tax=Arundo donax TaxID=35708 RepID=A0A0A9DIS8_ARUDO
MASTWSLFLGFQIGQSLSLRRRWQHPPAIPIPTPMPVFQESSRFHSQ